jgi:putative flippase GtrA
MARPVAGLAARIRHLVPELAKFGIVGGIGTVIDLGGAALLHNAYHVDPLAAKAISFTAATIFTYLGSRFWTFRHRENQPVLREAVLFITINFVGLVLAEAVIAFTVYGLGLAGDPIAYNAASVLGTALGTIFRFYAYRKWVFLAPAEQPALAVPANATLDLAEYPPWELDPSWHPDPSRLVPAYSGQPVRRPHQEWLEDPVIPNARVAPPLVTAAASAGPPIHPAPSVRLVPAGPRTPGRHRKTR